MVALNDADSPHIDGEHIVSDIDIIQMMQAGNLAKSIRDSLPEATERGRPDYGIPDAACHVIADYAIQNPGKLRIQYHRYPDSEIEDIKDIKDKTVDERYHDNILVHSQDGSESLLIPGFLLNQKKYAELLATTDVEIIDLEFPTAEKIESQKAEHAKALEEFPVPARKTKIAELLSQTPLANPEVVWDSFINVGTDLEEGISLQKAAKDREKGGKAAVEHYSAYETARAHVEGKELTTSVAQEALEAANLSHAVNPRAGQRRR